MKTHRNHHPVLLGTILITLFAVPTLTLTAQSLPRVGIAPLQNNSDDANSDTLAAEISQTINVNLDLLGGYEVENLSSPIRNTSPADLDSFAARNRYDNLIFGSISQPNARTTEFRVAMFDRAEGAVVYDNTWQITSVFEIFDTADRIVEVMLDQFSDERLAFGRLAVSNRGTPGDYQVYVNDNLLGENLTQTRILAGTHQIRVEQQRMFGTFVVTEERVTIPEDGRGQLQIAVPDFTDQEAARIRRFEERIVIQSNRDKEDYRFPQIIDEYIRLSRDLENASYSEAVSERKTEVEGEFNEFVAWYSEPTVIEREVEVQRGEDGELRRVGPGRPVAEPGSGGVLFRFSQPISDG
ncbi:MAG: hypothetical protein PF508_14270 [Spirochaeta sp.]|nr:hypothetical protein [Spirochaeta sp.]